MIPDRLELHDRLAKWLRVAWIIAASCRTRIRFALGGIDSFSGSTHERLDVSASVDYINAVFRDFLLYGGLTDEKLRDKRILELGPGDNVGVALRFVACGAREVICLDKFYSTHDVGHERNIYLELRKQLPEKERRDFDAAVQLENGLEFNKEKIRYVYGTGAQDAEAVLQGRRFDLVISRGVIQEVYETDRAFAAMDKLLVPGGMMLHKIDLRDYGMFSQKGFHPREFLTIPDFIYRLMAYDSDKPNRRMLDYYRNKMKELGYCAKLYITGVVEAEGYRGIQPEIVPHKTRLEYGVDYFEEHVEMIRLIRPRLATQFRTLTDQDLLAAAVFLVAVKPTSGAN